ncbi:MAG TPA: S41 family peptidase [Solirubrobacteraceae bacterium]|nr:S41 family peptidase [Solirubrobacteraceae bacterium]
MPLAVLLPVLFFAGIWIGGHPARLPPQIRSLFVARDVNTLEAAVDIIEHDYYRRVDRRRLIRDGLAGAVADLHDRFSRYLDPAAYRRFQADSTGRFSGVGMEVAAVPSGLRVARVFAGSPAARGGIRRGDEIVGVNGRSIAGRPTSQTTPLIRGRAGTLVTLTVLSRGRRRVARLRRAELTTPVVTTSLRTVGGEPLAVVGLSQFSSGAHTELRRAIDTQLARGARGVVLDLRDNGGGLLGEAVDVSSIFVRDGTIVSTRGRARPRRVYRASGDSISPTVPLVVLVNGGTASASEIVASAVQDHHRAPVAGTHTYGKGVYQEVRGLPNGGAIDITVGEYFTPLGRNLGAGGIRRGTGVKPDIPARDRPDTGADEALDVALRALAARAR